MDIPKDLIRVIPNGVDLNSFYKFEERTTQLVEQLNLKNADPLFLLPARLTPRKNIEYALHILAELRKQYLNHDAFGDRARRSAQPDQHHL